MIYFARSASENAPRQTYPDHVLHVLDRGLGYLNNVLHYTHEWGDDMVRRIFKLAAEYHDLGKLDDENQKSCQVIKKLRVYPYHMPMQA